MVVSNWIAALCAAGIASGLFSLALIGVGLAGDGPIWLIFPSVAWLFTLVAFASSREWLECVPVLKWWIFSSYLAIVLVLFALAGPRVLVGPLMIVTAQGVFWAIEARKG